MSNSLEKAKLVYDDVEVLGDNRAICRLGNKYCLTTSDGEVLTSLLYDGIECFKYMKGMGEVGIHTDRFLTWGNTRQGMIDRNGNVILDNDFDIIFRQPEYECNILIVKKDNAYGATTLDGNIIVPMEYSSIYVQTLKNQITLLCNKLIFDKKGNVEISKTIIKLDKMAK